MVSGTSLVVNYIVFSPSLFLAHFLVLRHDTDGTLSVLRFMQYIYIYIYKSITFRNPNRSLAWPLEHLAVLDHNPQ